MTHTSAEGSIDACAAAPVAATERRLAWLLGLLAAAVLAVFAVQHTIILVDYPDWVFQGAVVHAKVSHGEDIARYTLKPYPVPNAFVSAAVAVLMLALSPLAAANVLLIAYLVLFPLVLLGLAGASTPSRRWAKALVLYPLCVLATPFWWGSLSFQWGLLFFAWHLWRERTGTVTVRGTVLLSVAIFFCHAVVFGVYVLHLLMRRWRTPRLRRQAAALLPALGLAAWYVLGRFALCGNAEDVSLATEFDASLRNLLVYKAHMLLKRGPFQNLVLGGHGFLGAHRPLFWLGVAANVVFVGGVGLAVLRDGMTRWRARGRDERREWAFFAALAALFAILPIRLLGMADLDQRLLVLAFLGLVAGAPFSAGSLRLLAATVLLAYAPMLGFLAAQRAGPATAGPAELRSAPDARLEDRLLDVPIYAGHEFSVRLRAGRFDMPIFPTGLLLDTASRPAARTATPRSDASRPR